MKAFLIGIIVFIVLTIFAAVWISARIVREIEQRGLKSIIEEVWEGEPQS